jgi:uncharacterized membrane protein
VSKRTWTLLGLLVAGAIGGGIGFAWHAPGRLQTWDDIRTWATFVVVVLGFTVAAIELNMQRLQFAREIERSADRDGLIDDQRRELQDAQRLREREQAEHVDLTYADMQEEQGKSLAIVINNSRRPIRDVAAKFYIVKGQSTLIQAERSSEMYPVNELASPSLVPATVTPSFRQEVIRAGGRAGFQFAWNKVNMPEGQAVVRFTDDAGLHWQLGQDLHLQKLAARDW